MTCPSITVVILRVMSAALERVSGRYGLIPSGSRNLTVVVVFCPTSLIYGALGLVDWGSPMIWKSRRAFPKSIWGSFMPEIRITYFLGSVS